MSDDFGWVMSGVLDVAVAVGVFLAGYWLWFMYKFHRN
jgi:hypothetical protein